MADEKFKLPHASYEELIKMIHAYGLQSEPASLEIMSRSTGLHKTVISRNVGFLIAINILETGLRKLPTPEGKELSHAIEHSIVEDIQSSWRKIVLNNDFLSKILTAIRIRNGMEEAVLATHIAYSAGQPKKSGFMTGARTIIEIFRKAQLVKEQDGKIVPDSASSAISHDPFPIPITVTPEPIIESKEITNHVAGSIPIMIQVNINCGIADLDTLSIKIKELTKQLTSSTENSEQSV